MPTIELSHDDADILEHTLEVALSTLRLEIARTDTREYRDLLRARWTVLERLRDSVARLHAPGVSAPH